MGEWISVGVRTAEAVRACGVPQHHQVRPLCHAVASLRVCVCLCVCLRAGHTPTPTRRLGIPQPHDVLLVWCATGRQGRRTAARAAREGRSWSHRRGAGALGRTTAVEPTGQPGARAPARSCCSMRSTRGARQTQGATPGDREIEGKDGVHGHHFERLRRVRRVRRAHRGGARARGRRFIRFIPVEQFVCTNCMY